MCNQTWVLTKLSSDRKTIECKWVYKIKRKVNGDVERYKSELVTCGYSQMHGINYKETFSSVVRLESNRILLGLVASYDLEMVHFDVKTAFLYAELKEEIYMNQPERFEEPGNKVCEF